MEKDSFTTYMQRTIDALKEEERFGTAYIYGYALKAFQCFNETDDLPFEVFDKIEIKRFEQYLFRKGRSLNTISTYLRALRAVYNRAVDDKRIEGKYRLFHNVFTGVMSEKKLAVGADEMRTLIGEREKEKEKMNQRINASKSLQRARHLLTLMLLLQGIGFSDLAHLKQENLKRNAKGRYFLHFRRQKTGTELSIPVSQEALTLINAYRNKDSTSTYLLNLLDDRYQGEEAYHQYRRQLRSLNYGLSRLGTFCNIETNISSYTARHTWATLAKNCEVPEEIISEGLGHASLEITRTYLKRFEDDKFDKTNKIIYDYIFKGDKKVWRDA